MYTMIFCLFIGFYIGYLMGEMRGHRQGWDACADYAKQGAVVPNDQP